MMTLLTQYDSYGYGSNVVGKYNSSASTLCKDSSDVKEQGKETTGEVRR